MVRPAPKPRPSAWAAPSTPAAPSPTGWPPCAGPWTLGITYFDTSPMYCQGASQAVLGEALDGIKDDYLIATKLGYFADPTRFHPREALITQFEENLSILRHVIDKKRRAKRGWRGSAI